MSEAPPVPKLPGGPDPDAPIPREPVSGIDLAACAAISARLSAARGPRARAAVLATAGLDEMRWVNVEKTWMLRIASALMRGELELGREYDAAFTAAKAKLARSE